MTALDLNAIKARAEAATPGPWAAGTDAYAELHPWELSISRQYPLIEMDTNGQGGHDAQFIAHAREDVPALIAEVEMLRTIIADVAEKFERNAERQDAANQIGMLVLASDLRKAVQS
jgi:hypothetical protein